MKKPFQTDLECIKDLRDRIIVYLTENKITYRFLGEQLGLTKQAVHQALHKGQIRLKTVVEVLEILQHCQPKIDKK